MAEFLLGYAYEPEYTQEELEAQFKAATSVCTEATSAGSDWCQCAAVVQCRHHRNACAATPLN